MDDPLPTLELLEQRHDFPCPYTFKVIGVAGAAFESSVAECVRSELDLDETPSTSLKTTSGGRHQSVTIEPTCSDASDVLRLYRALRRVPGVMFLF